MVDSIGGSQFEYDADFDVSGIESAIDKVINKFKLAKKEANELKSIFDKMTEKAFTKIQNKGTAQSISTTGINKFETKYSLNTDEFDKAITKITNTINKRLEKYASDLAKAKAEAIANLKAEQQAEEQAEATTTSAEKKKQTSKKNTNKKIKENTEALKEEAQVAEETAARIEQAEAKKQKAYKKTANAKKNTKNEETFDDVYMTMSNGRKLDYNEYAKKFAKSLSSETLLYDNDTHDTFTKYFNWQKKDGSDYNEKDIYKFLMKGANPNSRYYNRSRYLANALLGGFDNHGNYSADSDVVETYKREMQIEYLGETGGDTTEDLWLTKNQNKIVDITKNLIGAEGKPVSYKKYNELKGSSITAEDYYIDKLNRNIKKQKSFEWMTFDNADPLTGDLESEHPKEIEPTEKPKRRTKSVVKKAKENVSIGEDTKKKNTEIETTTKKIKESVEAEEQLQKKVEKTAEVVEKAEAKQQQAIKKTVKTKQEAISFSPVENKTVEKNLASGNYFTLSNGKVIDYDKFVDEFAKTVSNDKIVSNKIQADGIKNFIGWRQGKNGKNGNFTDAEAVKKFFYDQELGIDDDIKSLLINGAFDTANKSLYEKAFNGYSGDIDVEDINQFRDIASKAIEMVQFALGAVKVGTGNSKSYLSWNKYQDALNRGEDKTALLDKMDAKRDKLLNDLYIDPSSNSKESSMLNTLYADIPTNNVKKETVEKVKNEEIKAVEDLGAKVNEEVKKVEKAIIQSSDKIQEQVKPTAIKSDMTLEEQAKVKAEMASMQKENQAYLEKMANKNNITTPVVKKNKNLVKAVQVPSEYDPFASIVKGETSWEDRRSLRGYYNWGKSQFENDDALLYSRATGKPVLTTDVVDIKDLVQDKSFYGGMDWNTRRSLNGYYRMYGLSQFYNTGHTLVGNPYDNNPYTREQQNLMQVSGAHIMQEYADKIMKFPVLEDKTAGVLMLEDKHSAVPVGNPYDNNPYTREQQNLMTNNYVAQHYIDKVRNAPLMIEDKSMNTNTASGNIANTANSYLDEIINKVKQWGQNLVNNFSTNLQDTLNIVSAFQEDMRNMANNIRTFFITLSSVIYSVTNVVKQLENVMSITDTITSTASRFERYDTTGASKDTLLAKLFKYSNGARSDIDSFGTLAQRILATDVTKGNGEEAMKLASIITKAMVLGGSTGQEISSAQLQLSQGLAANQLGGDELKALRENAVGFTEMLAKGLNKGYEQGIFTNSAFKGAKIGNLKDIGAKGLLTAEVVTKALTLMSDEIDSEFGKMPVLFSQTLNKLTNKFKEKLNEFNKEGKGLSRITNMFEKLANFIDTERGERVINNLMNMFDSFISFIEGIGNLLGGILGNETVMNIAEKGVSFWATSKVIGTIAGGLFGTSNSSGIMGSGGIGNFVSNLFLNSKAGMGIGETIWTSLFRQNKTGVVGGLIPSIILGLKTFLTGKDKNITKLTGVIKYINELKAHPNNSYNANKYYSTIASHLGLSALGKNANDFITKLLDVDSLDMNNGEIARLLSNKMSLFTEKNLNAIQEASLQAMGAKNNGANDEEKMNIFGSVLNGAGFTIGNKVGATTGVLGKIGAALTTMSPAVLAIGAAIGAVVVGLGVWNHFDKQAEEKDWTDFKDKYLNFDGHKYLTDDAKNRIINNARAQYNSKYNKWGKLIGGTLSEKDELDMKTSIMKEVVDAERTEYLKQISENTGKTADNTAGSFEITEEFLRNMNDIQTRQFKAQLGMSGYNGGVQNTWSVVINNQSDINDLFQQMSTEMTQASQALLT